MTVSRRALKMTLIASLALNLAVVGTVAGFFFSGGHKEARVDHAQFEGDARPSARGGGRAGPMGVLTPIISGLDRKERREIGRAIQKALRDSGANRAQRAAFVQSMQVMLRQDEFNRAEAETLFASFEQEGLMRLTISRGIVLDFIEGLDPARRAELAQHLGRRKPKS